MDQSISLIPASRQESAGPVEADLHYLRMPVTVRPVSYTFEPPRGAAWESASYEAKCLPIEDARLASAAPSLEAEGFALCVSPTNVRNFHDRDQVRAVYYPEVARLVSEATGAERVHVFDHLVRRRERGRTELNFGRRGSDGLAAANGRVHNDYTEASGRLRRGLVLGEAETSVMARRFAIFNVWRSIAGPVLDTPLAVCDARSLSRDDLVESEVRYPHRTGHIYHATYAPSHRWSYFSRMDRDEALVFKQFDSVAEGVPRFVPHAAFDHPRMPHDAPLRESIEVRCLAIY